jgi:lysophospholipase L1-like esterase
MLMLCQAGCGNLAATVSNTEQRLQAGPHSYLALGDSYTIGQGVATTDRWPVLLAAALRRDGIELDDPHLIAQTGWQTTDLQKALDQRCPQGPFKLVTLQIGVNDQYSRVTVSEFRIRFEKLARSAITLAGNAPARVVVLSIPDYDYGPSRKFAPENISETIDQFNAVCQQICQKLGMTYIDITPLSREARSDESLWAEDQLHFSGKMYRRWVEKAKLVAIEVLQETRNASPKE